MKLRIMVEADFEDDLGSELAAGHAANLIGLALEATADDYEMVVDPPDVVDAARRAWSAAKPWSDVTGAAITRMANFWNGHP